MWNENVGVSGSAVSVLIESNSVTGVYSKTSGLL